jgi:RND superfamily putative drug exporter
MARRHRPRPPEPPSTFAYHPLVTVASVLRRDLADGQLAARPPCGATEVSVFAAWGRLVYRRRRLVAVVSLLIALGMGLSAATITDTLSSGGWVVRSSGSARVQEQLAERYGGGQSQLVAILFGPEGTDARSEGFGARVAESLAPLADDPRVLATIGYAQTRDERFISSDGRGTYVVVQLALDDEAAVDALDEIEAAIAPAEGLTLEITGYAPLARDSNEQSEKDLQRAELVSLPLALLVLVGVFASIVAAGMPLVVAGVAIPTALGAIALLARQTEMSIYVLNVSTMLGLALAIDYSLFIVSRFREELARGRTVGQAVERAIATSGKAVAFSAVAVAIGLGGLLFFESSALTSIGVAGTITVASSALFAISFLPAVLGMLGPRVNALSVRGFLTRIRPHAPIEDAIYPARVSRWERLAYGVMGRPFMVIVPVVLFLLLLGAPFLSIRQAVPDAAVLPPGTPSRDAFVTLQTAFPPGETSPIVILAEVQGDPTSAENVRALAEYAAAVDAIDGIDRVESPFSNLRNPQTGDPLTIDQLVLAYATPTYRAQLQPLLDAYVRGSTVRLDAISPFPPAQPQATGQVPIVRALEAGNGIVTQVGGAAAGGYDFLHSMEERVPLMLVTVITAMLVVLFLLFGSVVLPVKAVLMTLLSLTASFGALVWIFQEGHLSGPLGFTAPGYTVAGNPIIMFAVIFGLSMDYEVLLLSRIQEAWRRTGDNTLSVGEGLARTAGVITGAALIMVIVFGAFALADTITIKAIGVGMAIAVALDATVIRVLLVPATMRLLGRWNWWAPGPLGRLADRLGFSHVEDEDVDPDAMEEARQREGLPASA